jgi:hypothetical protein
MPRSSPSHASPDEIGCAAVFLLDGSKASSMTGHFLNADDR